MSGYTGNDGSALIGGLNPSNVIQGIILDAQGRILIGSIANANNNGATTMANAQPVTIASNQTPVAVQQQLLYAALLGECFSVTTDKFTAAGASNAALSIFNPSSSKTAIIYCIPVFDATGQTFVKVYKTATTDPALGTPATPVNAKPGGGASSMNCTWATGSVLTTGATLERTLSTPSNSLSIDLMAGSAPHILPPNAANGIMVVDNPGAAHNLGFTILYFEY